MRDFEPPSLRHNQMASYFETLCVTIAGPALGFLHTRTNLSRFLVTHKYFEYLWINYHISSIVIDYSLRTLHTYLLIAETVNFASSNVVGKDDSSLSWKQATAAGEDNPQLQQKDRHTAEKPPVRYTIEGQRENLLYKEDLGFVPVRQDPRYVFYRRIQGMCFIGKTSGKSLISKMKVFSTVWSS